MNKQQMVKAMKSNQRAFAFWESDMKDLAGKIGADKFRRLTDERGVLSHLWKKQDKTFKPHLTYRLSPDYELPVKPALPEPPKGYLYGERTNDPLEKLAHDLYLAYVNKDEDMPHGFEIETIREYEDLFDVEEPYPFPE